MAVTERITVPAGLTVRRKLLLAARAVILLERPTFQYPWLAHVDGWKSRDNSIGLNRVELTDSLNEPDFRLLKAEVSVVEGNKEFSVFVSKADPTDGEKFDYSSDFMSLDVLAAFRTYLDTHEHGECLRARRLSLQEELAHYSAVA
jgi:hypothetical protein